MTAQHTIFVVEDDERMRVAIELLLRTEGYEVQSYPSAEAFLAGETCLQSICLLTDVLLPGWMGSPSTAALSQSARPRSRS